MMWYQITISALILFLFSLVVIRIFNEVENMAFRYVFLFVFLISGITIPIGVIMWVWS